MATHRAHPSPRAFVFAAAWWDTDAGPPRAELLPRDVRLGASFSARILAHVLDRIAERSPRPLHELPWVLGASEDTHELPLELRNVLSPTHGLACVHAGPATVAMALLEALGTLADHEAVLVAFVQGAGPPHHDPLASTLVLSREPGPEPALLLEPPALRRVAAGPIRSTTPFAAARSIARAATVGQPTVETIPSNQLDRRDCWQIRLHAPG
ncbi:hypothetical protein [Paraliomyxa miuraensis]|uniref:hypothetical protein n=1 Tax=Paraliomyxa miuraensis TaxID=376150 RepID=UPI002250D9D2|nr:hypothetical protein [Paraliomyxa miuraensis]MCX4247715.1 hypothetical protein [Paraliomyxa miuraensis]